MLFIEAAAAGRVKVVPVAPLMGLNVAPPLVLAYHCTARGGLPNTPLVATAVKLASIPAHTLWLTGCVAIAGGA